MGAKNTEAVKQQAYQDGYAAGMRDGQQQAQADLALVQQHLQNTLIALQNSLEQRDVVLQNQMLGLVMRSAEAVIGHAALHYAPEILEHHLRQILPLVKADESLTLRIHPSARGFHEKLQLPQASILGLTMRVLPDTQLGSVDAVVEWANGGVESRLEAHTKALTELWTAAGAHALPSAPLPANLDPIPTSRHVVVPSARDSGGAASAPPSAPVIDAATEAARARAAALLGDDELVDALK